MIILNLTYVLHCHSVREKNSLCLPPYILLFINNDLFNGSLADGLCGQHQSSISRVDTCIFHMLRDGMRDNLGKKIWYSHIGDTSIPLPYIQTFHSNQCLAQWPVSSLRLVEKNCTSRIFKILVCQIVSWGNWKYYQKYYYGYEY